MVQMGEMIAADFASVDPPSSIVRSAAGGVGDGIGEITYDVIGLGDDSVAGFRLVIFGTENPESQESFILKSIEQTTLCLRGLAGELCV